MQRAADSVPSIPELVAPAGTPDRLRTALHFGADAVYLGLKRFSLRAHAGNFGEDEIVWALGYARERGARVYVTVNVQPFDDELDELEATLTRLAKIGPDAVVVADAGVLRMARRVAPGLPLHLSTQASVTNSEAARAWGESGVRRIVLARELSVARIAAIAKAVPVQLEVFVHGAVCVGVSGRCFLSLHWAGSHRDPRHGSCAQPCRWPYRTVTLDEARYPGRPHELEEDERGTYFFDSRDLCALPLLAEVCQSGVRALKIEGRTRSLHYVGTVVDVYRYALDRLREGGAEALQAELPRLAEELARSSRRSFSTHFLGGEENLASTYPPKGSPGAGEAVFIGRVTASGDGWLDVTLETPLAAGSRVEIRDRGLHSETVTVDALTSPRGDRFDLGRRGDVVRLRARQVAAGALVRVAEPAHS